MTKKKKTDEAPVNFLSVQNEVTKLLHNYLKKNNPISKVLTQNDPVLIAKKLKLKEYFKNGFNSLDSIVGFVDEYLNNINHLRSSKSMGHQVAVPQDLSGIPEMIHGIVNNPSSLYEMGPAGSVIEGFMINWMLKKIGWFKGSDLYDFKLQENRGSGILTHGGSVANLTALSAARAFIAPDSWTNGTPKDLVVMGPSSSHYSIKRAMSIMGMGSNSFISIPVDENEKCKTNKINKIYQNLKNDGKRVMAVIANACATSTGLFDPIDEMSEFCLKNNLWFHVDAAHGAVALLSKKELKKIEGIEKADSVIWDAHKMMRVPALCTAVLFKNYNHQINNFKQKGSYVFHENEVVGMDTMPYTIECTKSALGTKLFWSFALKGEKAIVEYVENSFEKTKTLYHLLNEKDDFNCPYYPESNILCFQYLPEKLSCEKQLKLRYKIIENGPFYITSCMLNNKRFLRVVLMNPLTSHKDFKELITTIRKQAKDL
jgi:L-2,4-diaminobutyrate decarboxylase